MATQRTQARCQDTQFDIKLVEKTKNSTPRSSTVKRTETRPVTMSPLPVGPFTMILEANMANSFKTCMYGVHPGSEAPREFNHSSPDMLRACILKPERCTNSRKPPEYAWSRTCGHAVCRHDHHGGQADREDHVLTPVERREGCLHLQRHLLVAAQNRVVSTHFEVLVVEVLQYKIKSNVVSNSRIIIISI